MTTILSTITVSYKLSSHAAELLGDGATDAYETALTSAIEAAYPGAEVDVTVRLASVDESSFDARCETAEGVDVAVYTRGAGTVEVAADPESLDWAAQESIRENFRYADERAWQRACEGA